MFRRSICLLMCALSCGVLAQSHTPAGASPAGIASESTTIAVPPISFDVVSVKSDKSNGSAGFQAPRDGDTVAYTNLPLNYIVLLSNNFHRFDLAFGLPDWTKAERYDIAAKVDPSHVAEYHTLTVEQRTRMFQEVLADQFKLKFHREKREMPVYDLVVAKGGLKMKGAKPGDTYPDGLKAKYGQSMVITRPGKLEAQGGDMTDLALFLSNLHTGREVVDKTGLTGKYDFTLLWTPDQVASPSPGDSGVSPNMPQPAPDEPSIFTAIQEQLGLKLESSTGPVECFIVDHIERPSEN